ncbi:RNA-directed DNA polymerase from mobile element jockey-like [Brachionus plicatilis]|uniref:RNA-directed DNA polymerase from mobile element jockey-like n=1 Tax=Brachionus plicatilis TaxID=10195 RepID=A0A3M7PHV7_BRAPC|nr:RNA-directed DNA polymerase from mobile element jockey-like [Brachionus plicatilis]
MYKIINGFEKINLVNGINSAKSLALNLRRENNMRLTRELTKRGSYRYNFLTNRVVSKWNDVSQDSVSSKSINSFKSRIENELFGNGHNKRRKTVKALQGLNTDRR